MKRSRSASLACLAVCCAMAMVANFSHADDKLVLKDGSVIEGTIIQSVPGSHVVIRRADGATDTIMWADVKRMTQGAATPSTSASSSAPASASASSTPSAAPVPTVAPPVPSSSAPVAPSETAPPPAPPPPHAGVAPLNQKGWELGLRLGYGLPFGKTSALDSAAIGNFIAGQFPMVVEGGLSLDRWFVGAYVGFAPLAVVKSDDSFCSHSSTSCSGYDIRVGAQAHYRSWVSPSFRAWGGIGIGYELLSTTVETDYALTTHMSGIELINAQGGLEYRVDRKLTVGPFVWFTLGRYTRQSDNVGDSGAVKDPAFHEWLMFGLRGTYHL